MDSRRVVDKAQASHHTLTGAEPEVADTAPGPHSQEEHHTVLGMRREETRERWWKTLGHLVPIASPALHPLDAASLERGPLLALASPSSWQSSDPLLSASGCG